MNEAIKVALKRRQELMRELELVDRFIAAYEALYGSVDAQPAEAPSLSGVSTGKPIGPDEVADIAEELIRQNGAPMTRAQLSAAFDELGYILPSAQKTRYIGTILWRHKGRFINVYRKGYTIPSLQTPAPG